MSKPYQPPCSITPTILNRVAEIAERVGRLAVQLETERDLRLRRIHPFSDGNGRMGRLWQTLILSHWNPLFADIPVESLVHEHQAAYYAALQTSTEQADSAPFVGFMLDRILDAIRSVTPQVAPHVTPQVERLLRGLRAKMSREALQRFLKKHRIYKSSYPKIDAARRIAPKLNIQTNRSHSFRVFIDGVETLLT